MHCRVKQLSTDVSGVRAASIIRAIIAVMMEAARASETSADNYFTRQYIPEDKSELNIGKHFKFLWTLPKQVKLCTHSFSKYVPQTGPTFSSNISFALLMYLVSYFRWKLTSPF
jgi:hypothetical protein